MTRSYILAIDQGTSSSRAIAFDHAGNIVASHSREHQQIFPHAGWVEHDATEIWQSVLECIRHVLRMINATSPEQVTSAIKAVGITNQRETTVVWEKATGQPVTNAIVWQDVRNADLVHSLAKAHGDEDFRSVCGLPLSTYFSGPKLRWLLNNEPALMSRAQAGELAFGTIDSWLIWNLTGGRHGGRHATDVTNASRTMLMDLRTLEWSERTCSLLGIPIPMLGEILPSIGEFGVCASDGPLPGVPITGVLGDQQAAAFGQACFTPGAAKNTYGTGCFMLLNTGKQICESNHGLLTTLLYQIREEPAQYALEGSVAVTGSLIQWLRDNLGIIADASEVEPLAQSVNDNGGVFFVPAFSGLFAPYWRDDARGVIVGLTRYNTKAHLARAALEATAFQVKEITESMQADANVNLREIRVDGGMTANNLLMQFQADILGIDVVAPKITETTALGAAYAAGIGVGFWEGVAEIAQNWEANHRWIPELPQPEREALYTTWKKAVTRSFDWV